MWVGLQKKDEVIKSFSRAWQLSDLYAGILIGDWDQTFALDITQKSSVFCLFHFVVFVSVSKLFENENLKSYMITKIPEIIKSEF